MPAMTMQHDTDPKKELLKTLGDIKNFELFHNQVLVAIYVRPEKTVGGIIIPDKNREEDKIQGKVGLVVKMGSDAFNDETGKWFSDVSVNLNDWVLYRASEGWSIQINKVDCRILQDTSIKGRIQHPDMVW